MADEGIAAKAHGCPRNAEDDLDAVWHEANGAIQFPGSPVTLKSQNRLAACVRDTVEFAAVVRQLHAACLERVLEDYRITEALTARSRAIVTPNVIRRDGLEAFTRVPEEVTRSEMQARMASWGEWAPVTMPLVHRLAAGFKAAHFFMRSLQDSIYRVLQELQSRRSAGERCSMSDPHDHVRKHIDDGAPGYFEWFERSRALRNKIKAGRLRKTSR
jgi:hypothetical protein